MGWLEGVVVVYIRAMIGIAHGPVAPDPGEIAARLWDVLPSGEQRLISRGIWRIGPSEENTTSTINFQLHGNGYEFAKGDTVKLQLLGSDVPTYRKSNGTFTLEATNVTVSLPTP